MDKNFHLMRLEKTQTWIAAGLTIALFGGILVLPYWGQVVWVALIGAAWLRVVIVIMRKEKLVIDSGCGGAGYDRPEGGVDRQQLRSLEQSPHRSPSPPH